MTTKQRWPLPLKSFVTKRKHSASTKTSQDGHGLMGALEDRPWCPEGGGWAGLEGANLLSSPQGTVMLC